MTREERIEYTKLRMETAYKTYQAARVLSQNGFWNSAVNRLYYAVFYAVNALWFRGKSILILMVEWIRTQFSKNFIKTKKLDKKYGKLLAQLYDWRQKSDYENLFDFSEESVNQLFDPVQEMLSTIEKEILNAL